MPRVFLSSFLVDALADARRLAPHVDRWLNADRLTSATLAQAEAGGCSAVCVEWHAINEEALADARAAGLAVGAWTVRRRATLDRLARLGVLAVCVEGAALAG